MFHSDNTQIGIVTRNESLIHFLKGADCMNNKISPKKAIELYISSLSARGCSQNTIRQYTTFLKDFDEYLSGKIFNGCYDLEDIKTEQVQMYLNYLKDDLGNSDGTRDNKITCIRCFFDYLVDLEYLNRNVAKKLIIKVPQKTTRDSLNGEEVEKLMNAIDGPLIFTIAATILYAGLRVSEIISLTVEDVSLTERTIHIRMGKGKKERVVPINKYLHQILSEYEKMAVPGRTRYFATERSGHVTQQYVNKYLGKYSKLAGIQKTVSAHVLRHTFASMLARNGAPLPAIQSMMGHSSVRTTSIYLHSDMSDMQNAVDILDFSKEDKKKSSPSEDKTEPQKKLQKKPQKKPQKKRDDPKA